MSGFVSPCVFPRTKGPTMLTSPVNVTIAANGVTLKPHSAPSDQGAHREPAPMATAPTPPANTTIEPQLPSNLPMTNVNAVTATAGGRTILQDLSLQVATMLRLPRRPDENMTSLFIRIIAAIEAMPQAERLQFEVRTGLKSQKITLADLAMALRNPDGIEAARLTAISEAPSAVPGKTAVTAATTTYLQEGTADGHTEETLAMRAAARNSAAGQSVFAADAKVRHGEPQPMDAKALQSQLKSMFEPGSALKPEEDRATRPASAKDAVVPVPLPTTAEAETVAISTSNLRLDAEAVEKIRSMAQTITEDLPEALVEDETLHAEEVSQPVDRRVQTMLTLKGLAEVVAALPALAAEFLAGMQPDHDAPSPPGVAVATAEAPIDLVDPEALLELASTEETVATEDAAAMPMPEEIAGERTEDITVPTASRNVSQASEQARTDPGHAAAARPDLAQFAVPFAYAQLPPVKENAIHAAEEAETRDRSDDAEDEDAADEDEDGDKRRPRDEYDAIHDPEPEDEPAIRITRDSSEADRAFALYQRMGGF